MAHVFISYSREDIHAVDRLVGELGAAGVETWVDREGIQVGEKWRRRIVDAIEGADAVLAVLSPDFVTSDNVRKELDIAEEIKKPILPVVIRSTAIPKDMLYQLVGLQQIDLVDSFDLGVKQLVETVRKLEKSPQVLWSVSTSTRGEIKELFNNPTLSANDQLKYANMALTLEIDRTYERLFWDWDKLNKESWERARLRDTLRGRGDVFQEAALISEQKECDLKRSLLTEQMDRMNKAKELANAQLRALCGFDEKPVSNWFLGNK